MSELRCQVCARALSEGDTVWASDWKVIDVSGTTAATRWVTRYTCDDCEATR